MWILIEPCFKSSFINWRASKLFILRAIALKNICHKDGHAYLWHKLLDGETLGVPSLQVRRRFGRTLRVDDGEQFVTT